MDELMFGWGTSLQESSFGWRSDGNDLDVAGPHRYEHPVGLEAAVHLQ